MIGSVLAGAVAAAFTSGAGLLAGGGILGLGAFALREDKGLVDQFKKTFKGISDDLAKAAKPLAGPFVAGLKAVGKTFKTLTPDLKALFKGISPVVKILTDSLGPTLKPILAGLKSSMPGITGAFRGLGKALPRLGESIGRFFTTIFRNDKLIGRLTAQLVDFVSWIFDRAGPAIEFFTVIWGTFTNTVRAASMGWGSFFANLTRSFDAFTGGGLKRITDAWEPLRAAIVRVWDAMVAFASAETDEELATTFETLVQRIKEAWAPLKKFIGTVWDEIWAFVKKVWNEKVVPWWNNTAKPWIKREIGDFIKGIFKGLVNDALSSGKAIVQGLIDGLRISFPGLSAAASAMAGIVGAFLPNSPAKTGPLSGTGSPEHRGMITGQDYAAGITAAAPTVTTAADRLAATFAPGRALASAGPASAGPAEAVAGDRVMQALLDAIRESIRKDNGGDVVLRLGSKTRPA